MGNTVKKILLPIAAILLCANFAQAQIGDLIWEDPFNDLDNWLKITGNGSWGWGNGELEYYHEDNVAIASVPGEPGNTALHIVAKQESGPGITDQWGNPLNYTSGKVVSKSKVAIKYGMIETRMRIPDIELGGWPALWLLGTSNYGWPRSGEIDIMEMGSRQDFRDLHDEHNGGNGLDNSNVNQVVGANAIYYSEGAINPDNPTGASSLSWDPDDDFCRPYYSYANPLNDRFLTYRLYWDENTLRLTVIDGGVEHDLYAVPFEIDSESAEFQEPFYLIANLQEHGVYGLYTEETPTNGGLVPGETGEIFVWEGTLIDASIAPYEGENVLSWQTAGLGWFGAGIFSIQPLNLFDFGEGHLKFMINIPAHVTFKIGVIDAWGNQYYVSFPAHQTTYGLVRDGTWGQASIPISDLRGTAIDLRMLQYPFVILEENGVACEFGLDDIYWDAGVASGADDGDVASSRRPGLRSNVPNPFNAQTEIRFDLPAGGAYEVVVFDAAGRRVTSFRGVGTAGTNALLWDGRDESGRNVASGTFFYRLEAGDYRETRKMTMVK